MFNDNIKIQLHNVSLNYKPSKLTYTVNKIAIKMIVMICILMCVIKLITFQMYGHKLLHSHRHREKDTGFQYEGIVSCIT